MSRFEIGDQFYLDGGPVQIVSGAIHYFRVPRAYWRDRLEKLKAMGCNTVETYVPWNLHEPRPGEFCFGDGLDVGAFLAQAQALGLYAIVRPSPFICAEWEFGGLPAWLLAGEDIPLRSSEGPFLSLVARYYRRLFPELVPRQIDRGGNVILMQVENEFGSWGAEDRDYLEAMARLMRDNGATVPFVTSDNTEEGTLARGTFPGAHPTMNFGSGAREKLETLLAPYSKNGPKMVMEFWDGWFDAWGDAAHHTADAAQSAADLDDILDVGSVNFYMFHGGTNPGFLNGSNDYGELTPDVTSYDYDAPLTEDGQITPKYEAYRAVIAKHAPVPQVELTAQIRRKSYGPLVSDGSAALFDALNRPAAEGLAAPRSMERFGQSYGYILYRTTLPAGRVSTLELTRAADRAQLFLDGVPALTLYDHELEGERRVDWDLQKETRLDILVENLGRVNYGRSMAHQRKGVDGDVLVNGRPHAGWAGWTLSLEKPDVEALDFRKAPQGGAPAFFRFPLDVEDPCDTFVDLTGWGKGCVFVNGKNLGRFWDIGPQKRLYLAAPLLCQGKNDLVVLETEGRRGEGITLADAPDLG